MKILLILLTVMLITAAVTLLALNNPGYVMLGYGKTSLEMPLIDFLVLLSLLFIALYFLVRVLSVMRKTPKVLRGRRDAKHASKLQKGLSQGLIEMAEGNWSKAEKHLISSADQGETGMLNYLAAAHSAQRQNNSHRRDEYLRQASEVNPKAKIAVGLTQAELQIRDKQYEEALATLVQLDELAPKHPHVQKQLAKLQHQLQEWEKLQPMLAALSKNPIVSSEEYTRIEKDAAIGMLQKSAAGMGSADVDQIWGTLSKTARLNPDVVAVYCKQLVAQGASERAEPIIRKSLNAQWDDALAAIYGQLSLKNPKSALKQTEKWLQDRSDSAELLMAAARLSAEARLWGQARSLYQESLSLKAKPQTYAYMAELLESMGEEDAARNAYQTGLGLAIQRT